MTDVKYAFSTFILKEPGWSGEKAIIKKNIVILRINAIHVPFSFSEKKILSLISLEYSLHCWDNSLFVEIDL